MLKVSLCLFFGGITSARVETPSSKRKHFEKLLEAVPNVYYIRPKGLL